MTLPTGHCKACKEEKVKVYKRLQPRSGNKLYVDDLGRYWKSSVCPACQATIRRIAYNKAEKGPEGSR